MLTKDSYRSQDCNYITNIYEYNDEDIIMTFKYLDHNDMEVHCELGVITVDLDNYNCDENDLYDQIALDLISRYFKLRGDVDYE